MQPHEMQPMHTNTFKDRIKTFVHLVWRFTSFSWLTYRKTPSLCVLEFGYSASPHPPIPLWSLLKTKGLHTQQAHGGVSSWCLRNVFDFELFLAFTPLPPCQWPFRFTSPYFLRDYRHPASVFVLPQQRCGLWRLLILTVNSTQKHRCSHTNIDLSDGAIFHRANSRWGDSCHVCMWTICLPAQ